MVELLVTSAVNLDPPHADEKGLRSGLWSDEPVTDLSLPLLTESVVRANYPSHGGWPGDSIAVLFCL